MRLLFGIVIFLITYGSLYPFHFEVASYEPAMLENLFSFTLGETGIGDLVANVILFIPFGVLGVYVIPTHSQLNRFLIILSTGFIFAYAIQIVQLIIPGRTPAGSDAIWNIIGCIIGYSLGFISVIKKSIRIINVLRYPSIPVALACLWLIYHLAPFVPSLDLQLLKDNLKNLFNSNIEWPWIFQALTLWLVIFHFLSENKEKPFRESTFPIITVLTLTLGFFVMGNIVSAERIIGAILALFAWLLFRSGKRESLLVGMLFLVIIIINFTPFELRHSAIDFKWIPFSGALGNNLLVNVLSTFKKLLLYGSLVWLLVECKISLWKATLLTSSFLFICELLQVFFVNTTPEITDALLAIVMGVWFYQYEIARHNNLVFDNSSETKETDNTHFAHQQQHSASKLKSTNKNVSLKNIPGIDGLRAIAALAVFLVHFNQEVGLKALIGYFDLERLLSNGNTGVALFFVLSGFLLSTPFWQAINNKETIPSLRKYAWHRAGRIMPAYYFCLFTILFVKSMAGSETSWNNILAHLFFVYNISDWNILSLNQPFWTLAVEVQFYICLPLLFIGLNRLPKQAIWIVLALIPTLYALNSFVVISIISLDAFPINQLLIWPFSLYLSDANSFVLTYSTLGHLPHFLIGVGSTWFFLKLLTKQSERPLSSLVFDSLFLFSTLLVLIILATPLDDILQIPYGRYNFPFVPVLLAVMLVSLPFSLIARTILDMQLINWLGRISYGIYIYHYPVQKMISKSMTWMEMPAAQHALIFGISSLVITLICSQISYWLIEIPALRWIKHYLYKDKNSEQNEKIIPVEIIQTKKPEPEVKHQQQAFEVINNDLNTLNKETEISENDTTNNGLHINLLSFQYDFLRRLAIKLNIDNNQVCHGLIYLASDNNEFIDNDFPQSLDKKMLFGINKQNPKWTKVCVQLEPEANDSLGKLALKHGESKSYVLRYLLDNYMKSNSLSSYGSFEKQNSTHGLFKHWRLASVFCIITLITFFLLPFENNQKASFKTAPFWAGYDTSLVFDHHTHTQYSDGALKPSELVKLAVDNGCNALAITDHSATEGAASVEQIIDIRGLRQQYPELLLFAGIELNMPSYKGREHVNVIADPADEHLMLRKLGDIAEQTILSAKKGKKDVDVNLINRILKYKAQGNGMIVIYNHPSRKVAHVEESMDDILRWDKKAKLFDALSGSPGHQNAKEVGSYKPPHFTENLWDPVVSKVGGVWDQLLSRGYNISGAIASSDYHNKNLDKAPCSFSRIHLAVPTENYQGIIKAIGAGTFWADHGELLQQMHFSVEIEGLDKPAYPGSVVNMANKNTIATVSISVKRGKASIGLPLTTEIISNCRTGRPELVYSLKIAANNKKSTGLLEISQSGDDNKSCYVRSRVRLLNPVKHDLLAYSNSIRFEY